MGLGNQGNSFVAMTDTQKLFLSAAESVAKSHVEQITQSVVASMCDLDATEIFDNVASRHCWDDYCWQLQNGPYDNDNIGFGSTEQNFRAIAETFIQAELEKISPATLLLLSVYICEREGLCDGCEAASYSLEELTSFILQRVDAIASSRTLDLIGPNRADALGYDHTLYGIVGEAFSESGEHSELLSLHVDALLSTDAQAHKQMCAELLDHYMRLLQAAAEGSEALKALLTKFDGEIRALVFEKDLVPHIDELVTQIQDTLDDY